MHILNLTLQYANVYILRCIERRKYGKAFGHHGRYSGFLWFTNLLENTRILKLEKQNNLGNAMKLCLHIGMGKTGTTALQAFLSHERQILKQARIYCPGIKLSDIRLSKPIKSIGDVHNSEILSQCLQDLDQAALKMKGITQLVWSNESLAMGGESRTTVEVIKTFAKHSKAFDTIEIIMVFRRQEEWIESAYRQWVLKDKTYKHRGIVSPQDYLKGTNWRLDYNKTYDLWLSIEGSIVKVVSYDDIIASGGIVKYFCNYWGIRYKPSFAKYDKRNVSLGAAQSHFMAMFNRGHNHSLLPDEFLPIIRKNKLPEIGAYGAVFYSAEQRREISKLYVDQNRILAQKALGREELFVEKPIDELLVYNTGMEDAVTYLTMICKNQDKRINELEAHMKNNLYGKIIRSLKNGSRRLMERVFELAARFQS